MLRGLFVEAFFMFLLQDVIYFSVKMLDVSSLRH